MTILTLKQILAGSTLAAILLLSPARSFAQEPASATSSERASTPSANSPAAEQSQEEKNEAYRTSPSVRAFGAKLGMNPEQSATAFEVFNFVILAALLGWLLVRMLPKTFRDRNTAIQKHLVDARTATEEASARLGNVEARLAKLDEQIAAMRTQAEKDSALDEQRIKAAAEDEKQKILAAAEQEIAAATMQAHRQLQKYAAELAIDHASRKLVISAETDRQLIQNFAARLGVDDKGGQN